MKMDSQYYCLFLCTKLYIIPRNTGLIKVKFINIENIRRKHHENMEKEFIKHLDNAIKNYNIILNSNNIDNILK